MKIQETLDKIRLHWHKWSKKEQLYVVVALSFGFVVILYESIYSPIDTKISMQQLQIQELQDTLTWIDKVRPQILQALHAQPIHSGALLSLIQDELTKPPFSGFPNQLSQTNTEDVEIKFQQVPFNQLITWLWELTQHYQIQIKQLEVSKTDTPGVCQIRLVLSAG